MMPLRGTIQALYDDNSLLLSEGLHEVQKRIIGMAMRMFLYFGPLALLAGFSRARAEGWLWINSVHVASFLVMLVAVAVKGHLSYGIQSFIIVLLLFLTGCGNLLAWGLMSTFGIFFVAAVIFATVFTGTRAGIVVLAASAVFILGAGIAHWNDWLSFAPLASVSFQAPSLWAAYIASFIFVTGGCVALVSAMFGSMKSILLELRDRAEEAETGRERFEKVFLSSPEAMVISDAETGEIQEVNDGFTSMLEWSREEAAGKTAADLGLWQCPEERARIVEGLDRRGASRNERVRFRSRSGRGVTGMLSASKISLDGRPRILFTSRDITEQVRTEEQLKEIQERFRIMTDNLSDVLWLRNTSGEWVYFSPSVHQFLGLTQEEAMATELGEMLTGESLATVKKATEEEMQRLKADPEYGLEPLVLELEHIRADGSTVWGEIKVRALRGEDGSVTGYVGSTSDISKRRRAEAELLASREKLRSLTNRLTVAEEQERRRIARELHDRVIQQMAISKIRIERYFNAAAPDTADGSGAGIIDLLDRTIDEARSVLFEISPPIISLLGFEEAVRWLADRFVESHHISCDVRMEGVVGVLGEEVQITLFQAVREMLNNIAKHSQADRVDLRVRRCNGEVTLQVADNGVGFDPEKVGIRTDTLSGFGLFGIRERASFFGGELKIDSGPGQGARLLLTVPAS